MHSVTRLAGPLAFLAFLAASPAAQPAGAGAEQAEVQADEQADIQADGLADALRALDGQWLYVEDRTEGRPVEAQQPSTSATFGLRVEEDAVVVLRRDEDVRVALDGSVTEQVGQTSTTRYHGGWEDGAFTYDTEIVRAADGALIGFIRRVLRPTDEGLLVHAVVGDPPQFESLALYRHPQDIALPEPAAATIAGLSWLAGAWMGETSKSSTEERWGPPLGGAMLGTSRTVSKSKGTMVAFEYLRVVERDGGLVYVAQPNGGEATEFVLTELTGTRAVFENPRHDVPQRIVYELSEDGGLSASIGFAKGGTPQVFEFGREGG
jgi:hypothetical protein